MLEAFEVEYLRRQSSWDLELFGFLHHKLQNCSDKITNSLL